MDEMLWSQLHPDILEQVIARLPLCMLFRYRAVCKRWSSPSFLKACFLVERRPWFYMVPSTITTNLALVYDSELNKWHHIRRPGPVSMMERRNMREVASAGGLICFKSSTHLMVYNPLTGHGRKLPHLEITCEAIRAIGMQRSSCDDSFKIVLIHGEMPVLGIKVYDSSRHCWSQLTSLPWNSRECAESSSCLKGFDINSDDEAPEPDDGVYYLDKSGHIVASSAIQYGPSKEFCCVLTSSGEGEEIIVYFLDRNAKVIACRIQEGLWYELPPLLPSTFEYSVDIVNCGDRLLVVVLVELFESCTVRIWELNDTLSEWVQVLAMPPALSHQFYGNNADINCTGYHNFIMICISSHRCHFLVLCNIVENSWQELPPCYSPGTNHVLDFVSAFSFEPSLQV